MPCGVGDYTHRLAGALAEVGAAVTVVTSADPRVRAAESYSSVGIPGGWSACRSAFVLRTVLRTGPQVVHVQYPTVGYMGGTAPLLLLPLVRVLAPRVRVVLTLHEFNRFLARRRLLVRVAAIAAHLVVTPDRLQVDALGSPMDWRRPRIVEIPMAANIGPIMSSSPMDIGPGVDSGAGLVVGTWGFLRADKGTDTLLDAFDIVAAARSARLVFAGDSGPDAGFIAHVRKHVRESPHASSVMFTGWQTEEKLSATLMSLDVCVLPFVDGLAANRTTYLGAVAHGLYVVTTSEDRVGFDADSNTTFVPPGDPAGLAHAILEARSHPRMAPHDVADSWRDVARAHVGAYGMSRSS